MSPEEIWWENPGGNDEKWAVGKQLEMSSGWQLALELTNIYIFLILVTLTECFTKNKINVRIINRRIVLFCRSKFDIRTFMRFLLTLFGHDTSARSDILPTDCNTRGSSV